MGGPGGGSIVAPPRACAAPRQPPFQLPFPPRPTPPTPLEALPPHPPPPIPRLPDPTPISGWKRGAGVASSSAPGRFSLAMSDVARHWRCEG